MIFRQDISLQ